MPEWLIGALCSAPVWASLGFLAFALCNISSTEDKDIDPT